MDLEAWIPERVRKGKAYVPGVQRNTRDWIKLNTNEFPYSPSPRVPKAIAHACNDLRLYPEPTGKELRESIGSHYGVDPDCVVVFNGCDDALNCCIRGFLDPGAKAAFLNPSYSLYQTLLANHGVVSSPVEYLEGFKFPLENLVSDTSRLKIITTPNAPSGIDHGWDCLESILSARNSIVILDETYADFASWTALEHISKYPNLVVVRSFSKTFGLAGLRVGFAVAHPELVEALHKIRDVYNLDRLAQAGAIAALEDKLYYEQKHSELLRTRESFVQFLSEEMGWTTLPSSANFVFTFPIRSDSDSSERLASELYAFLVEHKILVRYFSSHPFVQSGVRISIGTPEQMTTLKRTLLAWKNSTEPGSGIE
jgi:histidinol-phosphate aminotransferase